MACPITVSKFVGTISLGLLTGLSFSTAAITIPSLTLLPTSKNASRSFHEVTRLSRKHTFRLSSICNGCLLFAYSLSPRHRKHPYLIWMCVMSTLGSYGVDYWFHRQNGFKAWFQSVLQVSTCTQNKETQAREEEIVVVEAEDDVNGESIQNAINSERNLQRVRAVFSGLGLVMGLVGLWGDRRP